MKKKRYFFLILAALFTSTSILAQDITSGLKLHYTFDDVAGGLVPDNSGNDLGGSMMGAADTITGHIGKALNLRAVEDYVQLPNDINVGVIDFSISFWFNPYSLPWWGRLFDFGAGTTNYMFLTSQAWDVPRFGIVTTGYAEQVLYGNKGFTIGVWQHFAMTFKFSESGFASAIMYLNGSEIGRNDAFAITPDAVGSTTQNYIGKSQYSADGTPDCMIDDFRFYTRALAAEDVYALAELPASLITEFAALQAADDVTQIDANLTLPTSVGTAGITVGWASSDSAVINPNGTVTCPAKYDKTVILTATLTYIANEDTTKLSKVFECTVLALDPVPYLLAKWDLVNEDLALTDGVYTVTDSESDFVATLVSPATLKTIGTTKQFNVFDVGNEKGYVDLGTGIGEHVANLSNFTIMIYYRTDSAYSLDGWGQPFWNFSNAPYGGSEKKGYMLFEPKRTFAAISPTAWDGIGGESGLMTGSNCPRGSWHHACYTQNGTLGTIFIDGQEIIRGKQTAVPSNTLLTDTTPATLYNYI
jgi:hypothetical protein